MSTNEELLETYNNSPATGRGIMFGKGPKAKEQADSFAAYATSKGAKAIAILDERKRYFVAERDGRVAMKDFKMHYIMDGKYDLIFSVTAANEEEATNKAEAELAHDGITAKHILDLSQIS